VISARRKDGPELARDREPEITHDAYDRIAPGEYLVYCRAARVYRDPQFKRWTCLLRWDVFDEAAVRVVGQVPQWLSFGQPRKDRDNTKPHASRRCGYWREWVRANGAAPSRADRLAASVFVKRMARVVVRDTSGPSPYSVVDRILRYETGSDSACHPVTQSRKAQRK
jgi:hypothetical protein